MKIKYTILMLSLGLLISKASSQTNDNEFSTAEMPPKTAIKKYSVTISPLHLFLPALEIMGEMALTPKFGLGVIAAYGSMTESDIFNEEVSIPIYELGTQLAYYATGNFNGGLQIGAEFLWIKIDPPKTSGIEVEASGLAIGPFLGYKMVTRSGFTFLSQLGYQFLAVKASGTDSNNGSSDSAKDQTGIVLLNLNIGWTF